MRKDGIKALLKRKSFYVLLGLAAVVISVNGFLNSLGDYNEQMEKYANRNVISEPLPVKKEQPAPETEPEAVPLPPEPETAEVIEETVEVSAPTVVIDFPLQGELVEEHSDGELVYSKTMEDWRTHNGIDIASPVGTAVKAAADGVIKSVGYEGLYGFCVTVSHNGFITKYCGLQESEMVSEGQNVKVGDVIGGVGVTAQLESAKTPHLHFELIKDDKSVNPLEYIQFN